MTNYKQPNSKYRRYLQLMRALYPFSEKVVGEIEYIAGSNWLAKVYLLSTVREMASARKNSVPIEAAHVCAIK